MGRYSGPQTARSPVQIPNPLPSPTHQSPPLPAAAAAAYDDRRPAFLSTPLSMASPVRSKSNGVNSPHPDEKKPTASGRGDGEEAAPAGMTRLPKLEVARILSRDPSSVAPYNVEAIRKLTTEERPGAPEEVLRMVADSLNEEAREELVVFQSWVLGELEEKGYVEVPDEFVEETEEARKRQGEHIDLYLPDRHFTTVVDDDGSEKLVFAFKKKEKVGSESESNQEKGNFMSCSAQLQLEIKSAFRKMLPESSQDVESDDEDEEEGDSNGDT